MELGLIYQALVEKRVDLVAGNSTDGLIQKFDLKILEDNKNYFPPYEAVPLVRQDTLEKYPQLRQAINLLAGKISDEKMQQMNYAVDVENRTAKTVAANFLESAGLVKP
jgi:glycine betaine/choline ABC-type transport system substrate-binding protein